MADIPPQSDRAVEIDLRALGRALWRRRVRIIVVTLGVALVAIFAVGRMTPLYRSQAHVLVENRDSVYTSPGVANPGSPPQQTAFGEQEIGNQVQLVLSRDVALKAIAQTGLTKVAEFNPPHTSLSRRVLILLGLARDPAKMSAEARTLLHYYENLNVYQLTKSHVISIDFVSKDPELAAKVANAVAKQYLTLQQSAKQLTTRQASTWLGGEIAGLRKRVAAAENKVEAFRSRSDLFVGSNNAPVATQQLGELNSQLATARSREADAEAKAKQIRGAVKDGNLNETLDIANSELMRSLVQQRALMSAALARESLIYLPQHPRLKQLHAQLAGLDRQIHAEALKLARAFEADAKLAASRVQSLRQQIDAQQKVASTANQQDIHLRALQRDAKAERDLLDQYLARYRDAVARENLDALPPDASVISAAVAGNAPYFPKPVPIVVLATLAALVAMMGITAAGELMRGPAADDLAPTPVRVRAPDVADRARLAMAPREEASAAPPPAEPSAPPAVAEPSAKTNLVTTAAVAAGIALPPGSPAAKMLTRLRPPGSGNRPLPVQIEAADASVVEQLAEKLAAAPKAAQAMDILMLSTGPAADSGAVALALAGALARAQRKAVVVDVAGNSPALNAAAPKESRSGLSDLVAGTATFAEIIHPDPNSPAHLVPHGAGEALKAATWQRLDVVFDALGFSYDFVLVVGPNAADDDAALSRLVRRCRAAALVSAGTVSSPATQAAYQRLVGEGIDDIVVLTTPAPPAAEDDGAAPASA